MVSVRVRETYDLHTTRDKMTVIGIHTPNPDIIKKNYPGLLMQCRAYRPKACDVRLACASVLPLDPQGVGLAEGDVSPEDIFNPILYKAMSNKGMSQLEARINAIQASDVDVNGNSAVVDVDSIINVNNDFDIYYGLLATHDWKHANPQSGLAMNKLKPLVYELVYNVGDSRDNSPYGQAPDYASPDGDEQVHGYRPQAIMGKAKEMPFINCTSYSGYKASKDSKVIDSGYQFPGFGSVLPYPVNAELDVPWIRTFVGCIIVPPSRLHELFFRMTVVWEIEFTSIRPLAEITNFGGIDLIGKETHYQNYSYASTKEAVTGSSDSILDGESCMVSANAEVTKVM